MHQQFFPDKGEPPRTGTATVRIYTLNKNDEPPKFSQQVNVNNLVADGFNMFKTKIIRYSQ